jgi:hypothetical protein
MTTDDLKTRRHTAHIRSIVDAAPPLTREQVDRRGRLRDLRCAGDNYIGSTASLACYAIQRTAASRRF